MFKLPKLRLPVELAVLGEPLQAEIFLADFARDHAGPERIEDLLASEEAFFPAVADGRLMLVARDSLRYLRVPRSAWEPPEGAAFDVEHRIQVTLDDGTRFAGALRCVAPPDRARLQDCLNGCGRFFALHEEDTVVLVNRACVATVELAESAR